MLDDQENQVDIIVGDIMKSLSVYEFNPEIPMNRLQISHRNPQGQWCVEMCQIN